MSKFFSYLCIMKVGQIPNEKAVPFILAGKSFFTFQNTSTGNRFTYKVVKHQTDDIYFVHVLTSPEIYKYIGVIKHYNFRHTPKSTISKDATSVRVFEYVFYHLCTVESLDERIEIYHDGRCGRCGRQLTTPDSVQNGFGPECIKFT